MTKAEYENVKILASIAKREHDGWVCSEGECLCGADAHNDCVEIMLKRFEVTE
jgi:hypothetical protein